MCALSGCEERVTERRTSCGCMHTWYIVLSRAAASVCRLVGGLMRKGIRIPVDVPNPQGPLPLCS